MNRYEALKHAVKAHAGQVDKCGQPYVLHPIAVAEAVERAGGHAVLLNRSDWGTAIAVALLHDVLEDTDYEIDQFALSPATWDGLRYVTHWSGQTYDQYIECVCTQPVASIVKLADLWHNLQPERQDCLPEEERESLEKRYLKARDRIWGAVGVEWWPEGDQR